jgi:hypothetical protein
VTTDVYSSESEGGACLWLGKTHGPRSKSETRSWSISLKGQAQPADLAETTSAGVRDDIRNRQHRPRSDVDGESRTVATTQPMPRQDVARVPQHAEAPDRRDSSIITTFPSPFSWQIDMPSDRDACRTSPRSLGCPASVSPAKLCDNHSPGALLELPSRDLIAVPLLFSR